MLKELPEKFSLYIPNKETSEIVQEKLFELTYEWRASGKKIFRPIDLIYPIVFTINHESYKKNEITYREYVGCDESFLEKYPIISLHEILERNPKEEEKEEVAGNGSPLSIMARALEIAYEMMKEMERCKCQCTHQ